MRLIDADLVLKSMKIVVDKCKTLDETIIAANMVSIVENAPTVDNVKTKSMEDKLNG